MYKILIVDDEDLIREGIRDNIDWNLHGFEFVGECENGREAIEAIKRVKPDVVLTDICMPFIDGIELARYISLEFPYIKVIFLTGYNEFQYAQQAVKLNAYDYILKPVTANELRVIINKVKIELDTEVSKRENLVSLKMQLKESQPVVREKFLNSIVSDNVSMSEDNLKNRLNYYNIYIRGKYFIITILDIDDYSELYERYPDMEDEQLMLFAIKNICEELVGRDNSGVLFQNNKNETIIIFSDDKIEILEEKVLRRSQEIKQLIEKHLKFTVSIGIGVMCSKIKDLNSSYIGAKTALGYRLLLGTNSIINVKDMEFYSDSSQSLNKDFISKLMLDIKIGALQEGDMVIENIFDAMRQANTSLDKCYIFIQQIIVSIIDIFNETDIDIREIDLFDGNISPLIQIYKFKTIDQMIVWMKDLCHKVSGLISEKKQDFCKIQTMKAEQYIKENYFNEDISLNSICKHLLLSTSYFSMIFKKQTGNTFIEYLTRIRLDKAKDLLDNTSLKTYEIASKIGYADPQYFCLIFKKTFCMTPSEYRKCYKGN